MFKYLRLLLFAKCENAMQPYGACVMLYKRICIFEIWQD